MTPKIATDKVNAPAVSQLAGEIAEVIWEPCPACGGVGHFFITMDMAIDAGDRSMAGAPIECSRCNGCGGIAAISALGESK